eukprot:scaffold59850_cov60-Phaeocystis_antarctica.AAC.1
MTRSSAASAALDAPTAARAAYSDCAPLSTLRKWSAVAASAACAGDARGGVGPPSAAPAPVALLAPGAYQASMSLASRGEVALGGELRRECSQMVSTAR